MDSFGFGSDPSEGVEGAVEEAHRVGWNLMKTSGPKIRILKSSAHRWEFGQLK